MSQLTIVFTAYTLDGENPPTKGSASGFPIRRKGGRIGVVITNDNPKNKKWAAVVGWKAKENRASDSPWAGPVQLSLVFGMKRPKKMPKGRELPTVKPDLDKMVRSVKDAMTKILYVDDAQIVALAASKEYSEKPGVTIELTKLTGG